MDMRKKIAAGNWKMNTTPAEGLKLVSEILDNSSEVANDVELIVCPPYTHLATIIEKVKGSRVMVGAQNCAWELNGAFTGEISVPMLKEMGVTHVIIGHSERREYFHESDEMMLMKVRLTLSHGLSPIFCIGEKLEEREKGIQFAVVEEQMKNVIFQLSEEYLAKVVIAYEPVWAIGTGKTATPEQAQKMHAFIRETIAENYNNRVAEIIPILYGGSVKGANAKEIFGMSDVDGGLIGGASLSVPEYIQIAKSF